MCINNLDINSIYIKTGNYLKNLGNRFMRWTDQFNCFSRKKRKNSDEVVSFYNPYFDPGHQELKEVVVVPNNKIIDYQPTPLYMESSDDDEIIFQKPIHKVEKNEIIKTREVVFRKKVRRTSSTEIILSDIPEDIDSSFERPSSEEKPYISSPIKLPEKSNTIISNQIKVIEENNLFFDDLEEEINYKNSTSKLSLQSVNLKDGNESEDNWDLIS